MSTFYLTPDGKTCHMSVSAQPNAFFELGFCAVDKVIDAYVATQSKMIAYFYKETTQEYLKKAKDFTKNNTRTLGVLGIAAFIAASNVHEPEVANTQYIFQINNDDMSERQNISFSDNEDIKTQEQGHHKYMSKFYRSFFISKLDAFSKILMVTEGKSHVFYKDNRGIAGAYGWNPITTPTELNRMIAQAMGLNKREKEAILNISEDHRIQSVPKSLKNLFFTDQQLKASVSTMMAYYEQDFLKVMKLKAKQRGYNENTLINQYYKLPFNQQAVLVHMTYKVGATNLLKYNDFFGRLFIYLNKPTSKNLELASNSFEYSYKSRKGTILRDTKVEKMHSSFFSDCLIDKNKLQTNLDSCREIAQDNSIGKKIKFR